MRIQRLEHHAASAVAQDLTWEQLAELLTATPKTKSFDQRGFNLEAWIPATLAQGNRASTDVISLSCLVLDFDNLKTKEWLDVLNKVEEWGLQYIYYSTRRHVPVDGQLRYRLVLRLSRNVLVREWADFWAIMAQTLAASTNDQKCKDPVRLYYWPVQIEGAAQFEAKSGGSDPLDVDEVLKSTQPQNGVVVQSLNHEETRKRLEQMSQASARGEWAVLGRATLQRLLAQTHGPYAEQGQRDEALYACATFIARRAQGLENATIVEVCMPQLHLPGCRHSDGTTFTEKLERARREITEKLMGEDPIRMYQLGREGPYNIDDLSTFCVEQGVPKPDYLQKQLLVRHQNSLYVFYEGNYVNVGTIDSGETSAFQKLLPAEQPFKLQLRKVNKDGDVHNRTLKTLLQDYGRAVDIVRASLSARTSTVNGHILTYAIAPRRLDLVPNYDYEIDAWLRSWGDDTLLDWLATAPKLDKATAALYLCGAPGVGKTMLAEGIAAIWGAPPTDMDSLGESFNDALMECPVVLADDTVPERFRKDSGKLRQLVAARTITLNRKFLPTSKMEGSLRFVFAMNNLHLFNNSSETVGRDDVDAICERLLFYRLPPSRAPFFPPARLAQYILWLEENRVVESKQNDRLWVQGRDSELHRHMRIASRDRSLVCQWLMSFLHAPHLANEGAGQMFVLGRGELLINPRFIYDKYARYLDKERQLSLPAIANVMKELGTRKQRGLYAVSLEDLAQWGQENSWELTLAELEAIVSQGGAFLSAGAN
jgi:hypothetical protein